MANGAKILVRKVRRMLATEFARPVARKFSLKSKKFLDQTKDKPKRSCRGLSSFYFYPVK